MYTHDVYQKQIVDGLKAWSDELPEVTGRPLETGGLFVLGKKESVTFHSWNTFTLSDIRYLAQTLGIKGIPLDRDERFSLEAYALPKNKDNEQVRDGSLRKGVGVFVKLDYALMCGIDPKNGQLLRGIVLHREGRNYDLPHPDNEDLGLMRHPRHKRPERD